MNKYKNAPHIIRMVCMGLLLAGLVVGIIIGEKLDAILFGVLCLILMEVDHNE